MKLVGVEQGWHVGPKPKLRATAPHWGLGPLLSDLLECQVSLLGWQNCPQRVSQGDGEEGTRHPYVFLGLSETV